MGYVSRDSKEFQKRKQKKISKRLGKILPSTPDYVNQHYVNQPTENSTRIQRIYEGILTAEEKKFRREISHLSWFELTDLIKGPDYKKIYLPWQRQIILDLRTKAWIREKPYTSRLYKEHYKLSL